MANCRSRQVDWCERRRLHLERHDVGCASANATGSTPLGRGSRSATPHRGGFRPAARLAKLESPPSRGSRSGAARQRTACRVSRGAVARPRIYSGMAARNLPHDQGPAS